MDATSSSIAVFGARGTVESCCQHLCYGVAWRQRKLVVAPVSKIREPMGNAAEGDRNLNGHLIYYFLLTEKYTLNQVVINKKILIKFSLNFNMFFIYTD